MTFILNLHLSFVQVTHFGCKSFALLFDDIDHNMCPADKEVFSSFAHAQVSVTNEIFQYLGEPEIFLFCPTGKIIIINYINRISLFDDICYIVSILCFITLTSCFLLLRVLWNILLSKCVTIALPAHNR